MLAPITIRRLRKLADFLANTPEVKDHFDMCRWVSHNGSYRLEGAHGLKAGTCVTKKPLIQCGMAACAFGWAATIPAFKRVGLHVEVRPPSGGYAVPMYKEQQGFNAAQAFFHISTAHADYLFTGTNEPETPRQWAVRCRQFIRDHR